jgi:hypothetical protein
MTSAAVTPAAAPHASRPRKIWMDGHLVDPADAKVSVYDHGLLYGDGCFEGLRGYKGRIFKMDSHLKRLEESAERIRLKVPYSRAELAKAMKDTMDACGLADCLSGRIIGVADYERQASVGLLAQRHRQRHLGDQRNLNLIGQLLAAALTKDMLGMATLRTDMNGHVLDHPEDRNADLLEHLQALAGIEQCDVLGRGNDDRAGHRNFLR